MTEPRQCTNCQMSLRNCFVSGAHLGRQCCLRCDHIVTEMEAS